MLLGIVCIGFTGIGGALVAIPVIDWIARLCDGETACGASMQAERAIADRDNLIEALTAIMESSVDAEHIAQAQAAIDRVENPTPTPDNA